MKILSGSDLAAFVKERQAKQVRNLRQTWRVVPRLAVVQTIDNPVIDTYVRLKRRYAEDIQVEFELHKIDQREVAAVIGSLNARNDVHGIIVQLPLADTSETDAVLQRVAPSKDVDGLGLVPAFDPATPMAISWLLAGHGIELAGKKIALVGRGRLVGAPLEQMWRASHLDVTVYDRSSTDMASALRRADIVVTATGVPQLITSAMLGVGAVVIDAGTATEDGVVVGDLAADVRARDDLVITPEKGGVGALTIAALMENVITAARRTTVEASTTATT